MTTTPPTLRLMSSGDAARALGVSPARINQLATTGELPTAAVTLGGRLFTEDDVLELARRRAEQAQRGDYRIKVPAIH